MDRINNLFEFKEERNDIFGHPKRTQIYFCFCLWRMDLFTFPININESIDQSLTLTAKNKANRRKGRIKTEYCL